MTTIDSVAGGLAAVEVRSLVSQVTRSSIVTPGPTIARNPAPIHP